jgi:dihydroneopterin aldolase
MDTIFINDLRLQAWVGLYPREKILPQTILIQLEIGIAETAASSDALSDTIDYTAIIADLQQPLTQTRFHLLERLAGYIAEWLLENFPARRVRVSATKPGILPEARQIGVIIERNASQAAATR